VFADSISISVKTRDSVPSISSFEFIARAPVRESFLSASCRWFAQHMPKNAALR
jgi:hypothetical protein